MYTIRIDEMEKKYSQNTHAYAYTDGMIPYAADTRKPPV
ncbi:hypothetical protein APT_01402 [Acetobacter pasteurianus NBRC 101655]|nr:hypothetical protein APT_01402 [Acetobacter pasteurianus NBRC 101655]CCT58383.1 hypothetical protein APA386B_264 [Acetobacter pasteurianus 386B]